MASVTTSTADQQEQVAGSLELQLENLKVELRNKRRLLLKKDLLISETLDLLNCEPSVKDELQFEVTELGPLYKNLFNI